MSRTTICKATWLVNHKSIVVQSVYAELKIASTKQADQAVRQRWLPIRGFDGIGEIPNELELPFLFLPQK